MDGTPIFDIKPYIPYADSHPNAIGGFTDYAKDYILQVNCPAELLIKMGPDKREALLEVLSHDPRPSYQKDASRVYGMEFAGKNIRFQVQDDILTVVDIQ